MSYATRSGQNPNRQSSSSQCQSSAKQGELLLFCFVACTTLEPARCTTTTISKIIKNFASIQQNGARQDGTMEKSPIALDRNLLQAHKFITDFKQTKKLVLCC